VRKLRASERPAVRAWLARWLPALLVMVFIFAASSVPKAEVPDFGGYDWPVKKLGHLVIYGLLGIAWLWGLAPGRRPSWREAALAVLLAALYGATDEVHQRFVPGRGAAVLDVGIDALGALLGVIAYGRLRRPPGPRGSP
jgi:hypothetical protein